MTHIMKIDEMLQMPAKNVEDFFKKNLKKDMTTSELLFAVCTKLKWKPAGEGYSYTDKMMRFSFSESGSDIKYPQLDTYFECEKTGEDKEGDYVKAKELKNAILWTSQTTKKNIVGK